MKLRRMLYALVVIVAAVSVGTWLSTQGPRKYGPARGEVASLESTATSSHANPPRRGAGTVGARAGSLGAVAAPGERTSTVSQHGDADSPRAPRPSPAPDVAARSTDAPPNAEGSGSGVEAVAPPTPGRDPRDGSSTPPDPTTIASQGAVPREASTPEAGETPDAPPDTGAPMRGGESVTADAPLSQEAIEQLAEQKLRNLSPEEQARLMKIVIPLLEEHANQAYGWTTPSPPSSPSPPSPQ